jgi:hypothetical protein
MRVKEKIPGNLLFFGFVLFAAGGYRAELFERLAELSLFLPDRRFWAEHLLIPGDLLRYAGAWLTQFFYHPWLGAGLLAALLTGVQLLAYKAFPFKGFFRNSYVLSFVPSLLLFFSIFQLDYVIFYENRAELLFSQPLGLFFALGIFCIAGRVRRITHAPGIRFGVSAAPLLLYPLLGFYALLPALLLWIREWKEPERMSGKLQVAAAAGMVLLPLLFFFCYDRLSVFRIYTTGTHALYQFQDSWRLWWPYPALLGWLLGAAMLSSRPYRVQHPARTSAKTPKRYAPLFRSILNTLLLAVCCAALFSGSQRNPNFYRLLKVQRALQAENYDAILQQTAVGNPDRALWLYRNLALWKKNRLCEELFNYPLDLSSPTNTIMPVRFIGPDLYTHYGQVNHAYRWLMENTTLNGVKAEYLREMLELSVLTGESALAVKYYNILRRTRFYGKQAEQYREYLLHPGRVAENAALSAIRELRPATDILGEESSYVEPFLLRSFWNMPDLSFQTLELKMSAVLLLKKGELFREVLEVYRKNNMALPRYVQEAALLFLSADPEFDRESLHIAEPVFRRYDEFVRVMQNHRPEDGPLSAKLRKQFGDTYWCYFTTVQNVAVI